MTQELKSEIQSESTLLNKRIDNLTKEMESTFTSEMDKAIELAIEQCRSEIKDRMSKEQNNQKRSHENLIKEI